ncbi:MAG: type II CAAX endopeptidase family protein [Rikenellaceae bacterium]
MNNIESKDITEQLKPSNEGETTTQESAPTPTTKATGASKFPAWFDLLAIMGIFLLARFITSMIFITMGWSMTLPEGFELMNSALQHAAEQEIGKSVLLATIIMQPTILILVLIYRTLRRGKGGIVRLSLNGFNPTIILWGVIMLLSLVVVMEPLMQLFPQNEIPTGRGIYMVTALLVVAPLFEELLCRGVILESIRNKWGAWSACFVSALIFGVMHQTPQSVINAFIIGLLLGYIYLKTNSIFAPIILHSVNNIFAYVLIIFGLSETTIWDLTGGGVLYILIYGCGVAIMILSFIAMAHFLTTLRRAEKAKKMALQK